MRKLIASSMILAALTYSGLAAAEPGEYWEVTSKMEMEGMPFAMPGTTMKVCIAKGSVGDPRKSAPSKDCTMSDVKFSGNKTSWKVHCNHNGDISDGTGEFTHTPDSYKGNMHMTSTSHGEKMDMNMALSGKRIGGACDTGEMAAQAEAQKKAIMGMACDTSGYGPKEWVASGERFLRDTSMCPGKKDELCKEVKDSAPQDSDVYSTLIELEKTNGKLIEKSCKLNMASITHSICGKVNDKNVDELSPYCPAEAKRVMEERRKRADAEGRSFSGHSSSSSSSESGNSPTNQLLDTANKLKGLFGF